MEEVFSRYQERFSGFSTERDVLTQQRGCHLPVVSKFLHGVVGKAWSRLWRLTFQREIGL